MIFIDYGTGIGSGVFTEGRLLRGHCETAGEFGHTHVMADGPPCKCGSFGCLEAIASAPALAAKARKALMDGSSSRVTSMVEDPAAITGWHVLRAAEAGVKMCSALVEDMGNYLGLGIANLVNIFNPAVVVLGRRLELAGSALLEQIARIVKRQALPQATALGGWKLIRTLGGKFYRIRPVDGFAAQLSSSLVILAASLLGGPVSTTQVVSSAIMGVGAAERVNKVRWGVAQEIAIAWLMTIPASALVGAGLYWIIIQIIP